MTRLPVGFRTDESLRVCQSSVSMGASRLMTFITTISLINPTSSSHYKHLKWITLWDDPRFIIPGTTPSWWQKQLRRIDGDMEGIFLYKEWWMLDKKKTLCAKTLSVKRQRWSFFIGTSYHVGSWHRKIMNLGGSCNIFYTNSNNHKITWIM